MFGDIQLLWMWSRDAPSRAIYAMPQISENGAGGRFTAGSIFNPIWNFVVVPVYMENAAAPMSPLKRMSQRLFYVTLLLAAMALLTRHFCDIARQTANSAMPNPILSTK